MVPNIYMHEQLARERLQTLLREAEHERKLAEAQHASALHLPQHLRARLGKYLLALGTKLQSAQAVE